MPEVEIFGRYFAAFPHRADTNLAQLGRAQHTTKDNAPTTRPAYGMGTPSCHQAGAPHAFDVGFRALIQTVSTTALGRVLSNDYGPRSTAPDQSRASGILEFLTRNLTIAISSN
jgi:hypothetical protein